MIRQGFPFSNHVSFVHWLAARVTYQHVQVPSSHNRVTKLSKIGAFTPKILSTIQPITILEGQRWEDYRAVSSPYEDSFVTQNQPEESLPGDEEERSSSSSLGLDNLDMLMGRNDNNEERQTSHSSNSSDERLSWTDVINGEFIVRTSAADARILERLRSTPGVPVLPPPYPYPEEPPPTYEEAMFSVGPSTPMDDTPAEEVAVTMAQLDSVLSQYSELETPGVQELHSAISLSEEGAVHLGLQSLTEDSEALLDITQPEVDSSHSTVSQGVQTEDLSQMMVGNHGDGHPAPPVSYQATTNCEFDILY